MYRLLAPAAHNLPFEPLPLDWWFAITANVLGLLLLLLVPAPVELGLGYEDKDRAISLASSIVDSTTSKI